MSVHVEQNWYEFLGGGKTEKENWGGRNGENGTAEGRLHGSDLQGMFGK